MRNNVLQFTKAYIHDNKSFIDGNIAEHLLDIFNSEANYNDYYEDEEVMEMHSHDDRVKADKQVREYIKDNFDYDISKFKYI